MENLFVPHEQALSLQELGFSDFVFGYYYTLNGTHWNFGTREQYNYLDELYDIGSSWTTPAPLYQQAFKFFRDKGRIFYINMVYGDLFYFVMGFNKEDLVISDHFETYEQTELECIKKLIEICQIKNNV
jgi:hypothetical protein